MEKEKIENILKIVKFFDDARWNHINNRKNCNESFINGISDNGKILTHWLRYITNRSVIADNLGEKASKCFSEIIYAIEDNYKPDNFEDLLKKYLAPSNDDSYFKKYENDNYMFFSKISEEHQFVSRYYPSDYFSIISTIMILGQKEYEFNIGNYFNKVFELIKNDFELIKNYKEKHPVQKIIFSLYLLTYYYNPQLKKEDIESKKFNIFDMAKTRNKIVNKILSNKELFDQSFSNFSSNEKINTDKGLDKDFELQNAFKKLYKWQEFLSLKRKKENKDKKEDDILFESVNGKDYINSSAYKQLFKHSNKLYNQKRIWCAFRDYLKNNEFKELFANIIDDDFKNFLFTKSNNKYVVKDNVLKSLELPGDLWNNRNVFWECTNFLMTKNKEKEYSKLNLKTPNSKKNKSLKTPKIIRDTIDYFYKENKTKEVYYPEQFDITFDFIRRMCEENNCDVCPFGKLFYQNVGGKQSEKGTNFSKLCYMKIQEEKFCPVAALACNYKVECKKECELLKIFGKQ